jgi:hypothetical protein
VGSNPIARSNFSKALDHQGGELQDRLSAESPRNLFAARSDQLDFGSQTSPEVGVREPFATATAAPDNEIGAKRPAHPSNRLVAQLNATWRVLDDPLQWILQGGGPGVWRKFGVPSCGASRSLNSRQELWRDREHWRGCAKALEGAREGHQARSCLAYAFSLSPALHHRPQSLAPRLSICPRGRISTLEPSHCMLDDDLKARLNAVRRKTARLGRPRPRQ